jgi:uncharacterized repeat protein (TIGR01451 family)
VTVTVVTQAADPFPGDDVTADGTVANTATVTSPGSNCDPVPLGGVGSGPALRTVSVSVGLLQAGEVCESAVELPVRPTVTIDKTAGVDRIVPGGQVPYRIQVTNPGPATAVDVVVTDRLPEGFLLVSSSNTGCTAPDGRTLTCTLGDVEGGVTVTIDIVARAPDPLPAGALDPSGGVANTASVRSPGSNCDPAPEAGVAPLADEVCSSTVVVAPADQPGPPPGPTEPASPPTGPPAGPTPPDAGGQPGRGADDAGPFGALPRTGVAIAALLAAALIAIGTGHGLRRSGRTLRRRVGGADR